MLVFISQPSMILWTVDNSSSYPKQNSSLVDGDDSSGGNKDQDDQDRNRGSGSHRNFDQVSVLNLHTLQEVGEGSCKSHVG